MTNDKCTEIFSREIFSMLITKYSGTSYKWIVLYKKKSTIANMFIYFLLFNTNLYRLNRYICPCFFGIFIWGLFFDFCPFSRSFLHCPFTDTERRSRNNVVMNRLNESCFESLSLTYADFKPNMSAATVFYYTNPVVPCLGCFTARCAGDR